MKRAVAVICLLALLPQAGLAAADYSRVTIDDVLTLLEHGLSEETVLSFIEPRSGPCDVSTADVASLRAAGASEPLIRDLLERQKACRSPVAYGYRAYGAYAPWYPYYYSGFPRYYHLDFGISLHGVPHHWRTHFLDHGFALLHADNVHAVSVGMHGLAGAAGYRVGRGHALGGLTVLPSHASADHVVEHSGLGSRVGHGGIGRPVNHRSIGRTVNHGAIGHAGERSGLAHGVSHGVAGHGVGHSRLGHGGALGHGRGGHVGGGHAGGHGGGGHGGGGH